MEKHMMVRIMEQELIPALGCTEPMAFGLCAAAARKYAPGNIQSIHCEASAMMTKGVQSVLIPRSGGKRGGMLSSAIGAVGGDSDLDMEVLSKVTPEDVAVAEELVAQGKVTFNRVDAQHKLFLKTTVITDQGSATAIIQIKHNNIAYIEQNGNVILDNRQRDISEKEEQEADLDYESMSVESVYRFCTTCDMKELAHVKTAMELTKAICRDGMDNPYGMQVGRIMQDNRGKGVIADDVTTHAIMWTAAGVDARMGGSGLPAMSNSGSGNQGITCTMPVVAAGEYLGKSEAEIIRAVALSNLLTIYVKTHSDRNYARMAPVCCAAVAAGGAGCGIAYLYGADAQELSGILRSVLGNVAGLFCDGAKGNCSLKVSTNLHGAIQSMVLAQSGISAGGLDGIVEDGVDGTIENFFRIQKEGMATIENVLYDIQLSKQGIC